MWDKRVNTAIDEVARQMTEGSPAGSADFRRRVLARVEAGDAPRPAWRAAFVLSPLAVAAVIVMAVFAARGFQVVRRPGPLGPGVASPVARTAVAQSSAPQPETVSPDQITVRLKPDTTSAAAGPPKLQAKAEGPGIAEGSDEPALQVDSLDVAPLRVDALTPDPIQIERLDAIPPINVAPLDITDVQRRYE